MTHDSSMEADESLKIIANKQNAARTGMEQAADLSPIFKPLKKYHKTATTADSCPPLPLKTETTKVLDALEDTLKMSSNHQEALIDFVTVLTETLGKTATPKEH